MVPCAKYINDKIKQYGGRLQSAISTVRNLYGTKNHSLGQKRHLERIQSSSFASDAHLILFGMPNNMPNFAGYSPVLTLQQYNNELQKYLGEKNSTPSDLPQGTTVYQFDQARQQRDQYSPQTRIIMQPQIQAWIHKYTNGTWFGHREPLNEEIEVQAGLAIAHGADGISWFIMNSFISPPRPMPVTQRTILNFDNTQPVDTFFMIGLLDPWYTNTLGMDPRHKNWYGQDKWNYVSKLNKKILNWKPTLDVIKFDNGYSVHSEGSNHNFISDIKSIRRNESYSYTENSPCTYCDTDNQRYWEMGFFNPDFNNSNVSENDKSKYFIMVNRRCVPDVNNVGDFRQLKIKFNSSQLSGFKNWKIIELDSNKVIRTFDKDSNNYVIMGEFNPGEGRLYKLAPVMQEGGTFVTDEEVVGSFDCKGVVNNGGKNLTIKPATIIYFTNNTARIKMNGGNFKSGLSIPDNSAPVYLKGKDGTLWKGISLEDCPSVELLRTYFENIAPYQVDSTYAVVLINCAFTNINQSHFRSEIDLQAGGIRASYLSNNGDDFSAYVINNIFEMDAGGVPAVTFISTAGLTLPLIIDNNNFIPTNNYSSLNAIFLSNVTGGVIKNNNITGYKNSIIMLSSSMDFYGNIINGNPDNSIGIQAYSNSNANLSPVNNYDIGGKNVISSEGANGNCVFVVKSLFDINNGDNIFDLKNYQQEEEAYHLSGFFPTDPTGEPVEAVNNCFKLSGNNTNAIHNVRWVESTPVDFIFEPYNCEISESEGIEIVNLENEMTDTIYMQTLGGGGGISNDQLSMFNEQLVNITSMGSLYDSVCINMRRRNYESVISNGLELLNNFPDSIQCINIISILYQSNLRLDSAGSRMTNLKSFLETLILNNPNNEALIRQAFYYTQKCKVSLEQYESAMNGFQQIINQNPYSYEGLVASWDYAATSLLDSLYGSGGGISNYQLSMFNDPLSNYDDPKDKYDAKSFTKEDRKVIKENVFNSFKTSREKEVEIIKTLETKVEEGNATKSEKNELMTKKVLSEIVKAKEPVDIAEHIKIVNDNIQTLFGSVSNITSGKDTKNNIPTEYHLSQNYPNPFNPITKISFDLPTDAKVKLVVYDLLGREVKSIVNSQLTTGRYTFEFNGSNFASGVYFYRLTSRDFTAVKRMVLIK